MDKKELYDFTYEQYAFSERQKYCWLRTIDESSTFVEFLSKIILIQQEEEDRDFSMKLDDLQSENNQLLGDLREAQYTNEDIRKEIDQIKEHNKKLLKEMEERAPNAEILERMRQSEIQCNRRIKLIEEEKEDLQNQLEIADGAHHAYLEAKLHF